MADFFDDLGTTISRPFQYFTTAWKKFATKGPLSWTPRDFLASTGFGAPFAAGLDHPMDFAYQAGLAATVFGGATLAAKFAAPKAATAFVPAWEAATPAGTGTVLAPSTVGASPFASTGFVAGGSPALANVSVAAQAGYGGGFFAGLGKAASGFASGVSKLAVGASAAIGPALLLANQLQDKAKAALGGTSVQVPGTSGNPASQTVILPGIGASGGSEPQEPYQAASLFSTPIMVLLVVGVGIAFYFGRVKLKGK